MQSTTVFSSSTSSTTLSNMSHSNYELLIGHLKAFSLTLKHIRHAFHVDSKKFVDKTDWIAFKINIEHCWSIRVETLAKVKLLKGSKDDLSSDDVEVIVEHLTKCFTCWKNDTLVHLRRFYASSSKELLSSEIMSNLLGKQLMIMREILVDTRKILLSQTDPNSQDSTTIIQRKVGLVNFPLTLVTTDASFKTRQSDDGVLQRNPRRFERSFNEVEDEDVGSIYDDVVKDVENAKDDEEEEDKRTQPDKLDRKRKAAVNNETPRTTGKKAKNNASKSEESEYSGSISDENCSKELPLGPSCIESVLDRVVIDRAIVPFETPNTLLSMPIVSQQPSDLPISLSRGLEKISQSDSRPEILRIKWDSLDNSYSVCVKGEWPKIRERVQWAHLWGLGDNAATMKINAHKLKDEWVNNLGASKKHSHPVVSDEIIIRDNTTWGRPFYQASGKSCVLTTLMTQLPANAQKDIKSSLPLPNKEVTSFLESGIGKSYDSFLHGITRKKYLPYRIVVVIWSKNMSPYDTLHKLVTDMTVSQGTYIVVCGAHCVNVDTELRLFVEADCNSPIPLALTLDTLKGEGIDRCNQLYELIPLDNMRLDTQIKYQNKFNELC